MKVRSDFVTNSSSSSFILSFKDEDSIEETLKNQFPKKYNKRYKQELLEEIHSRKRLSKRIVKNLIDEELYNSIRYRLITKNKELWQMSSVERFDFFESDEGKELMKNEMQKVIDEALAKIGDDKVIVEVSHGDDGEDGVLENDIIPRLACKVIQFSHH